jgi:hypothetical protein
MSSAWSSNPIFGQVSFFSASCPLTPHNVQIKRISLAKNILRALDANDVPPLAEYPRSHQVCTYLISLQTNLTILNQGHLSVLRWHAKFFK